MLEDMLSDPTDDTGEGEQERLPRTETSRQNGSQTTGDHAVGYRAGSLSLGLSTSERASRLQPSLH